MNLTALVPPEEFVRGAGMMDGLTTKRFTIAANWQQNQHSPAPVSGTQHTINIGLRVLRILALGYPCLIPRVIHGLVAN
jgi:hypothetical protein